MTTIKQQKAIANVVENGGNVSRAMMDAGYSPATAKTPQKLTESVAWKEIMQKELPDDLLAKVHKEGLEATKGDSPDFFARHKYLDSAYKLKGSYAPEKSVSLNVSVSSETRKKSKEAIKQFLGRSD